LTEIASADTDTQLVRWITGMLKMKSTSVVLVLVLISVTEADTPNLF